MVNQKKKRNKVLQSQYRRRWRKTTKRGKETRYRERESYYARGREVVHSGRPRFTESEDQLIISGGLKDVEIAKRLDRTIMSIQLRRWRLKNNLVNKNYQQ